MNKKTALITGGATGLGKEIAFLLMDQEIDVIVMDRIPVDRLEQEYLARIKKYITIDLTDTELLQGTIAKEFSKESVPIDILIINAFPRIFSRFQDLTDRKIADFVNAAYTNQLILTHFFLTGMIENDFGRIITISSKSAVNGYSKGSLYCSLKAAWNVFHESLEIELSSLKKNITITTICPDSFSDPLGQRLKTYDSITGAVKKIILKSLGRSSSKIYYPITLLSRVTLTAQLFSKLSKLW